MPPERANLAACPTNGGSTTIRGSGPSAAPAAPVNAPAASPLGGRHAGRRGRRGGNGAVVRRSRPGRAAARRCDADRPGRDRRTEPTGSRRRPAGSERRAGGAAPPSQRCRGAGARRHLAHRHGGHRRPRRTRVLVQGRRAGAAGDRERDLRRDRQRRRRRMGGGMALRAAPGRPLGPHGPLGICRGGARAVGEQPTLRRHAPGRPDRPTAGHPGGQPSARRLLPGGNVRSRRVARSPAPGGRRDGAGPTRAGFGDGHVGYPGTFADGDARGRGGHGALCQGDRPPGPPRRDRSGRPRGRGAPHRRRLCRAQGEVAMAPDRDLAAT